MSTEEHLPAVSTRQIQGLLPGLVLLSKGIKFSGDETSDDFDDLFSFLASVSRTAMWLWGDSIAALEGREDIADRYRQIIKASGMDETQIRNAAYVCSRIPIDDRSEALSFSHHLTIVDELRRLDRFSPEAVSEWISWAEKPANVEASTRVRTVTETRIAIRQKYMREGCVARSGIPSVRSVSLQFRRILNLAGDLDETQKRSVVEDAWPIVEFVLETCNEVDPDDLQDRLRDLLVT